MFSTWSRLVVGQVELQQAEAAVDRLVEPELAGQQVDGPDAAGGGGPRAVGDFVMDVGGRHHRPVAAAVVILVQAAGDLPLASLDLLAYLGTHSKTLRSGPWSLFTPLEPHKTPKVFALFMCARSRTAQDFVWLRARLALLGPPTKEAITALP